MGKITVTLKEQVEDALRLYVSKKYPKQTYGKLSLIVNKAVKEWLEI